MNLNHKGEVIINDSFRFSPKSLSFDYDSLASENSGRTLDGVMHIYWIFNRIRKLEIELPPSSSTYIAQIFSRVQGQEYDITYWDLIEDVQKTIHVYTSNSSADTYSGVIRNGLFQGAKFNAIEIAGEINYMVVPTITPSGNLVITLSGTTASFSRVGESLIVDDVEPGISYAIEQGDLIRYEG